MMADKVLEIVRIQLKDGLTLPVIKQLLDALTEARVLNEEEAETILEENLARADKARKLIDSVKKKGRVASEIMIAKLKIHDEHLYKKIDLDNLLHGVIGLVTYSEDHKSGMTAALYVFEVHYDRHRNEHIHLQVSWDIHRTQVVSISIAVRLPIEVGPDSADYDTRKEYRMETKPRGLCVIINNVHFKNPKINREGSDNDADALEEVFKLLGFAVHSYKDQTAKEMQELMQSYSKRNDHGDCYVCCMLSHGKKEGVNGTDQNTCSMKDILSPFDGKNCPSLAGKPKVFFIQACRGHERQEKVHVTTDVGGAEIDDDDDIVTSDDPGEPYTIPKHSDFLVSMSTVEDHVSYRNKNGSWFIQSLCSYLKAGSERGDDILTILTEVNNDVSRKEGHDSKNLTTWDAKMTPEPRFTLRKKLIFRIP